eukprot:UN03339
MYQNQIFRQDLLFSENFALLSSDHHRSKQEQNPENLNTIINKLLEQSNWV